MNRIGIYYAYWTHDWDADFVPFLMPGGEVGRDIKVFRDLRHGLNLDREAARACRFVKGKLRTA